MTLDGLVKGALDGVGQATQVILQDEIGEPEMQQFDRCFLADAAGNQDHRQFRAPGQDEAQGNPKIHAGNVEVGKHHVPVGLQRSTEVGIAVDAPDRGDGDVVLPQEALQQQEIGVVVLDDENVQRAVDGHVSSPAAVDWSPASTRPVLPRFRRIRQSRRVS
jgi:hypothetical protein